MNMPSARSCWPYPVRLCILYAVCIVAGGQEDSTTWDFVRPLVRPLVVCTTAINRVTARCSGGQYMSESMPEPGRCPDGSEFCGYEVELFQYVPPAPLSVHKDWCTVRVLRFGRVGPLYF